ncbi:permease prefix domain 1-containing protein [Heyndrickxia sp. NPDC080065]|uniref:permease prefix domain 1-containing protein n=1 Tax=Heyndrickxia sp. NPDC080065 TaxID=3390568 RepID=UPI003D040551
MLKLKVEYIDNVKVALDNHPDAVGICNEISSHIEEGVKERMLLGVSEKQALEEVLDSMGDPIELGKGFCTTSNSKQNTPIHFILINWCFFIGGFFIAISNQASLFPILSNVWTFLVHMSEYILLLYLLYWFYIGYFIGKQYGPKGKRLVRKTLIVALIPNVALMVAVLFEFYPEGFFSPLLNPMFLFFCVLSTLCFYPISKVAYKFGIVNGL